MMAQSKNFWRLLARFQSDDRGAVTVDWVVMTAAAVSLSLGSIYIWRNSSEGVANQIADTTSNFEIKTTFD